MYEPLNTSVNSLRNAPEPRPQGVEIKSETQQFADDVCERLLNKFTPKQVLEIVTEIRKTSMSSLSYQAEQARITSKEYAEIAEQIVNFSNQL
jgi:hypothetical protein